MNDSESPVQIKDEWTVHETYYDPSQIVTSGSNFMTGNGYLGYRGTFPEWSKDRYVGCVVSDTYDNADGKWKELCTVPNALYARVFEGEHAADLSESHTDYRHGVNVRHGRTFGGYTWITPSGSHIDISFERFASYQSLHLIPQKITFHSDVETKITLRLGVDADIWSLHGNHFPQCTSFFDDHVYGTSCSTAENGLPVTVAGAYRLIGASSESISGVNTETDGSSEFVVLDISLPAGEPVMLEQVMAVYSGNDTADPYEKAVSLVRSAVSKGFDRLAEQSDLVWDDMWNTYSIKIDTKDNAQALLNYNLYHNIIATPAHTDHLPIGARGLSCQGYQGAAFWDQEIFNLPMFLYTDPVVARNLLTYRYKTLNGARRKAKRLGYYGAFYAWISGDTGDELCPDFFFIDVLTGRKIRNHFNDWQMHISPDIAYTVWHYYMATGDWNFIREYGAEMLFEIASFLVSYSYFKMDKKRYEILRVLGPDEYHENVDNNAFSNVQAVYALEAALEVYESLEEHNPETLDKLKKKLDLKEKTVGLWKDMAEKMYIPSADPDSGLIDQFDGYFDLEDTTPEELNKRLKDPGEYWGWPNGVAYHTQVIKQADIVQLFCLHPDRYDLRTVGTNYDYYEPRTQHRSSLSPAVHSIVAARIHRDRQAYDYFTKSCTIDLYNTNPPLSGGTFIGGVHTAACGIAWQMVVFGFAGFRSERDHIRFEPNLPEAWESIDFNIIYRSQELSVHVERNFISIESINSNADTVEVRIGEKSFSLEPGGSVRA